MSDVMSDEMLAMLTNACATLAIVTAERPRLVIITEEDGLRLGRCIAQYVSGKESAHLKKAFAEETATGCTSIHLSTIIWPLSGMFSTQAVAKILAFGVIDMDGFMKKEGPNEPKY